MSKRTLDRSRLQRGDTIIEVLLSIGVLSVLITTTYTVMSQSLGLTYNSLDRTNTQAVLNGQVNMLRAAHAKYTNPAATPSDKQPWQTIVSKVKNTSSESSADKDNRNSGCSFGVNPTSQAFYFDPSTANPVSVLSATQNIRKPDTGATPTPGDGIWIEGYEMSRDSANFIIPHVYTFYVKACTSPIYSDGSNVNRETKTAVRLYAE